MRHLNFAIIMMRLVLAVSLLLIDFSISVAEPMPESEIPVRYTSWHIAYDVNADGSYVEMQRWSGTILKEQALEKEKKAYVTFSTSVARGEILEAYTIKKSSLRNTKN